MAKTFLHSGVVKSCKQMPTLLSAGNPRHDASAPSHLLMPVALQAGYEDMTVAVVSLARAGALCSIGNVTSRATSSAWCLLCRCCFALRGAQVLARTVALLVKVTFCVVFDSSSS